jgi:phosphonate transport system permease protein
MKANKPLPVSKAAGRNIFAERRLRFTLFLLAMLAVSYVSSVATRFDFFQALESFPKAFVWLFANMIPNADSLSLLPAIMGKLVETIFISIMATFFAAVLAFLFALMGSRTTRPHPAISAAVRLLASIFRNIPIAAWAMIFLFSFGQSSFTGFLAIFIETFGFLIRAFIETIDERAGSSVEALSSSGATWSHTVAQSVLPEILPQIVSWMLYMVETNIRSATLVGILTGTGIGFAFNLYYKSMNYPASSMVILLIVLTVLSIEAISNHVRRIIL